MPKESTKTTQYIEIVHKGKDGKRKKVWKEFFKCKYKIPFITGVYVNKLRIKL